jgi:hypothetical protein
MKVSKNDAEIADHKYGNPAMENYSKAASGGDRPIARNRPIPAYSF